MDWKLEEDIVCCDVCVYEYVIEKNDTNINACIEKIKQHPEATCLLSVTKVENFLTAYKWLIKDGEEYVKSIFFENNDDANLPRKSYPDTYIPNTYVDVLVTKNMVEKNCLHGNTMLAFPTEETVDIDTESDFIKAEKEAHSFILDSTLDYLKKQNK